MNTKKSIILILLVASFLGCFAWKFFSQGKTSDVDKRFSRQVAKTYKEIEKTGGKYTFIKDSLVVWGDNSFVLDYVYAKPQNILTDTNIIIETKNGVYLKKNIKHGDTTDIYLSLIKYNYKNENRFAENKFNPPFNFDKEIEIVNYKTDFPIIYKGKTVGYLEVSPECLKASAKDKFIFRLWLLINLFVLGVICIVWQKNIIISRNKKQHSEKSFQTLQNNLRTSQDNFQTSRVNMQKTAFFSVKSGVFWSKKRRFLHNNLGSSEKKLPCWEKNLGCLETKFKTIFKKAAFRRIFLAVLYIIYAVFVWFLCSKIDNFAFKLYTSDINYNNILIFITVALSGFLVYLITEFSLRFKVYSSENKNPKPSTLNSKLSTLNSQPKIIIRQFVTIWIITLIAGLSFAVNMYSLKFKVDSLEFNDTKLSTLNTKPSTLNTDLKNFSILMENVTKDSLILSKIKAENYEETESYIAKYYLSLLSSANHTNVLVFNERDSMIVQPKNKYENILSYVQNRISAADEETLPTMFFYKGDNFYIFAECLKKQTNKNMNYSLFLDEDGSLKFKVESLENENFNQIFFFVSVLFLMLIILLGIEHLINAIPNFRKKTLSIKSKILLSLLGSFAVSLIIIGFFSVKSTIDMNNMGNLNILKEKTESIALEIEKILDSGEDISDIALINLSNTFLTDINIFDTLGNLAVCSQEDIFNKGIISRKMNYPAFEMLRTNPDTLFYQKEKICNGDFLASYVTVSDYSGGKLLYINIPFINQQKIMKDNINNLINNFANLFLFLVNAAVIIFVFLSNIITKPLELVKRQMAKINVNTSNEKIEWKADDEMGDLIKSYNLMVEKIEQSAILLKNQERQASWRELAAQVAHDIKNPLTPMKLSIQYLQRIYNEKPADFDKKFNEIAPSLISQIESISTITQELNSYSKPSVKKDKVDLNDCILAAINLFSATEGVEIRYEEKKSCYTLGEMTLFIRIFNNLIKNALQSLYNKPDGRINIAIKQNELRHIVSIEDNGCGIKAENFDKIFNTSFTTKTDGSGIGLTIVKTILESYNASIYFKSKENIGTVFFVEFDILK